MNYNIYENMTPQKSQLDPHLSFFFRSKVYSNVNQNTDISLELFIVEH